MEAGGGFDGFLSPWGSECSKQRAGGATMKTYLVCPSHRPRRKRAVVAESYAMAISKGALALDCHRDCVVILEVEKIL